MVSKEAPLLSVSAGNFIDIVRAGNMFSNYPDQVISLGGACILYASHPK